MLSLAGATLMVCRRDAQRGGAANKSDIHHEEHEGHRGSNEVSFVVFVNFVVRVFAGKDELPCEQCKTQR